jgi:membrane-associated phospholipid phosphatase
VSASPHGHDGHDTELGDSVELVHEGERSTGEGDVPAPRRLRPEIPRPQRGLWLADLLGSKARFISATLLGLFLVVTIDIFVQGPLTQLDVRIESWDGEKEIPSLRDAAWIYDKMGQRSVLVPILLIVAGVFARRHRTWRPVVLAMVSFVVLNVVVGAVKILIGRSETETGDPSVFSGGVIYPSGHSSNMVLTGGLIIYFFWRYAKDPPLRRLTVLITFLTTLTIATSLYVGSHWLTDLVAGVLVGGLLLQLVILFDRATVSFRDSLTRRGRLGSLLRRLQPDRHRVDAVPVAGGGLRGVVEDVPEVRAAATAPHLDAPHEE